MSCFGLHLYLRENLVKELHSLIVIDCQELVEILLGNLMGEHIAIDDSRHLVFSLNHLTFSISKSFHSNVTYHCGSTMLATTLPFLTGLEILKAFSVYRGIPA